MENIYDFIINHPTWEKAIIVILLPVLGWAIGKVYDRHNGDNIFSNKRLVYRLLVCSFLGVLCVTFHWHVIAWLIFCFLIIPTAFLPLPHEYLILKYGRTEKQSLCLLTTPALLRFYWRKIINTSDPIERQDAILEFLDEVRIHKWSLFDYEYSKYLEVLKVYFDIGAISILKEKLEEFKRFSENKTYIQLLMFYYDKSCMYREMEESFKRLKEITVGSNDLSVEKHIDKMAVAEKMGEAEKEELAVKQLEEDYKKVGIAEPILCSNLMQYYNRTGQNEKADKLARDIENCKPTSFDSYLNLKDIAFMHYRRTNNQEHINSMLHEIWATNEKMQDGEKKMLTQVRLMPVYFNNGALWMQYSAIVFRHHNDYLNKSWRVGVELIKQTGLLCRDAHNVYNLQLGGRSAKELFDDFDSHVDEYIQAIDNEIASTRDECVNRYKALLMDKLEMVLYKYENRDIHKLTEEKNRIYERILNRCAKYGEIREYLHFLTAYIDDILTSHQLIEEHHTRFPAVTMPCGYDKYEKSWDIYRDIAVNMLAKLDGILADKDYDLSLAYYVLYASYFHHLMNDQNKALYYFKKFESTGVSIKNFALAIQQMYNKLKIEVADEPVRWESPFGKFGYANIKFSQS